MCVLEVRRAGGAHDKDCAVSFPGSSRAALRMCSSAPFTAARACEFIRGSRSQHTVPEGHSSHLSAPARIIRHTFSDITSRKKRRCDARPTTSLATEAAWIQSGGNRRRADSREFRLRLDDRSVIRIKPTEPIARAWTQTIDLNRSSELSS